MASNLHPCVCAAIGFLLSAGVAQAATESRTPAMKTTPGGSLVLHAAAAPRQPTPTGERTDYADGPTKTLARFTAHRLTLPPGGAAPAPRRQAHETFSILQEGALEVTIEGRTTRVGPGSMWWVASNDLHHAANAGDTPASYLEMGFHPATAPERATAAPAAKPLLASTVWEWSAVAVKPTRTGERRDITDGPTRTLLNYECHITTLNAGNAPHAGHHHPDEEIFVVKEGVMEAVVGGETHRFGPGDMLFVASGEEHGWRNVGGTTATYHVIRFISTTTPPKEK